MNLNGYFIHIAISALVNGILEMCGYCLGEVVMSFIKNRTVSLKGINKWGLAVAFISGVSSGILSATKVVRLVNMVTSAVIAGVTSYANGENMTVIVITTVITFLLSNQVGAGKQFSTLSNNLMKKLKSKELKQISKAIIYYIKSISTLYNRYFKELFKSSAKGFALNLGIQVKLGV